MYADSLAMWHYLTETRGIPANRKLFGEVMVFLGPLLPASPI